MTEWGWCNAPLSARAKPGRRSGAGKEKQAERQRRRHGGQGLTLQMFGAETHASLTKFTNPQYLKASSG
jgi:hypothetical protein